jgi:hypothetical protein
MIRLTDIQLILLSSAAQRIDGSLLPPPASLAEKGTRIGKTIQSLINRAYVMEAEVSDTVLTWREDGEQRFGVFITDAGRIAIGAEPIAKADGGEAEVKGTGDDGNADAAGPISPGVTTAGEGAANTDQPKRHTKIDQVITLLQRPDGATLDDLVTATGWLPHTTRAALTGLRKKGHAITKGKRGDTTCYSLAEAA